MENLDWSWVSLGVDETDLMCVDPVAAAQALRREINKLTDGEVATTAQRFGLNIRSDAMVLRNRLERHEMRRHFGHAAAPWDSARDEPADESTSAQSPLSVERQSAALSSPFRVPEQPAAAVSEANIVPLSTGQSLGRFRDPISMEMPSQTFMSQIHIELGDPRVEASEATAGNHAALAVRNNEAEKHVSIAAPVTSQNVSGSVHHPNAQSTRYQLSPPRGHEHSSFIENSMDLTSIASAVNAIPLSMNGIDAALRPSENFDRTSFLPFPAPSAQRARPEADSNLLYTRRGGCSTAPVLNSLPSSHIPQFQASDALADRDLFNVEMSRNNRVDFQIESSAQLLNYGRDGAGAAVYSQCPMPRGAPGYHEQPLMSSVSVANNSFSAAATHASGYAGRGEPERLYYNQPAPPPSSHYPHGYFSQPYNFSQPSLQYNSSYPPYSSNIAPQFSQFPVAVPPPAVTGFQSAPMYNAASFQPHPGRFDVSAPGLSQDASFFERSSLIKEKRTSELLSKWHISYKGDKKRDPESFIADLTKCKETYKLTLDEIIKALPSALDDESWQWFRREYQFWKTYDDLVDAFRLQYSFEDVQERLRKELEVRTQGPSEGISTYLLKVRDLLDQLKPPLTLGEQLDRVYQKLHPSYRLRIERKDFENFPELQKLGKREELRRAQEKAYKPPPAINESAFPASAYTPPKTQRSVKIAPVAETLIDVEEGSFSSSSNLAPVATTQTDRGWKPRSAREKKPKPAEGQPKRNKDQGREARSKSRGRTDGQKKDSRPRSTEKESAQEPPKIEVVPPSGKYEDMQRRKAREPCFRCGQAGHWRRECMNAAVCQNCGQQNTTTRRCTKCNSTPAGNE